MDYDEDRLNARITLPELLMDEKIKNLYVRMKEYMSKVLEKAKEIEGLPEWACSYRSTFKTYAKEEGVELADYEFDILIWKLWGSHFGITSGNYKLLKAPRSES